MKSKILQIRNTHGKTAYNPTIPFKDRGITYMGVRVESLGSELDSRICFAHRIRYDRWKIDDSLSSLPLQDPTYIEINGELIISGIKVRSEGHNIIWNQEFYRGDSIRNLEHFVSGPVGMKDIRLVNLEDRVGITTRPPGKVGGLGRIGYMEIGKIDELAKLTESDWYNAKLIDGLFGEKTWGGTNQILVLPNDILGVIGHKAYGVVSNDKLMKHYYAISFKFDPKTYSISNLRTIARRVDFPPSSSKRNPELDDVVFPAGIDDNYNLYCGLSDYCIGVKKIENPF